MPSRNIEVALANALMELDARTAPNAAERPTPVIKEAVNALLADVPPARRAEPSAGHEG